jgi:cation:H+ antiporter
MASLLMIWRLEAMLDYGMEGTVLGTLIMPYCSGLGNLIFAFVMATSGGSGTEVMTNCLVNNVTNLSLLIGLPAIFWGMRIVPNKNPKPAKKGRRDDTFRMNRLAVLLTLIAVLFFTVAMWALARDGKIDLGDGIVLVGLFFFWQCFHVFEVLKSSARQNKSFRWLLFIDLALLGIGAYGIYVSVAWLVDWLSGIHAGFLSAKHLGWLTGWLMVLPNALLAMYYGWRGRPDIIYSSQIGDGHICVPFCVGIYALYNPLTLPAFFHTGVSLIVACVVVHFFFVAIFGQLPRFMGWFFTALYGYFLYNGLIG